MSKQISLTLPDEVMRRAEVLAGHAGRPVSDVLADVIEASLDPLDISDAEERPIEEWSDEQVLRVADAMMSSTEDRRLGELLARRNAGEALGAEERAEFALLMQSYQAGLLRKSRGIGEAVRRGLRSSPNS